jgi:hypothetical protein
VPVLACYHQPPLASAAFGRDGLVTGGTDPERGNITNPLITALASGTGLSRLDTSRLRATWLADCAELPGLATFMRAAGITCSQRLGDIIATLEPGDAAATAALRDLRRYRQRHLSCRRADDCDRVQTARIRQERTHASSGRLRVQGAGRLRQGRRSNDG